MNLDRTSLDEKIAFCKTLSIMSVCRDIGNVDFRGSSRSAKSPFRASSKQNSFSVDERHNVFTDWGYPVNDTPRGVASGDAIDFVRYLHQCNFATAVDYIWKYYHGSTITYVPTKVDVQKNRHDAPDLTPEQIDKAYRIFLELSSLDQRSKDVLSKRNLTNHEIELYGFKTCPKRVIKGEINRRLRAENIQPESVPGFYLRKGDTDATFNFIDSIMIPIKTIDNLILGLQMRKFADDAGSRYVWFSSSSFCAPDYVYDGKSPGTPLGFVDEVKRNNKTLFITEGMFKAIAINKCYGCPVISVQGVGNFKGIEDTISKVLEKYPSISRILIAYDADFIGNVNVASHAVRLYKTMHDAFPALTYQYVMWDEKYGKGFDDMIQITGGWNVKAIVQTIDMEKFSAAFEEFRPIGQQLDKDNKKDEIGPCFKKILFR